MICAISNSKAKFYVRDTAGEDLYRMLFWVFKKYIGIPKKMTERYADRIEFVTGDHALCDGAWLIPHKTPGLDAIGCRELMFTVVSTSFTSATMPRSIDTFLLIELGSQSTWMIFACFA